MANWKKVKARYNSEKCMELLELGLDSDDWYLKEIYVNIDVCRAIDEYEEVIYLATADGNGYITDIPYSDENVLKLISR